MSEKKDTGGSAFPLIAASPHDFPNGSKDMPIGMSLRDWFAGQALTNPDLCSPAAPSEKHPWTYQVALDAYAIADAMIEARKQ